MWKTATFLSIAGTVIAVFGTESVRSFVHRHRERSQGIGGTQDIAMIGTIIGWLFIFATIGCGIAWWITAEVKPMRKLFEQPVLVEHVLDLGDEAHVLIVVPDGVNFELSGELTLGGKPIRKWLSQPRALDDDGKPRLDLFNVILKSRTDLNNFEAGERVILTVQPLPKESKPAEQSVPPKSDRAGG